jgi:hypothetical protein
MIYVTESIPKQNHQYLRKVVKAKKSAAQNFVGTGPISYTAQAPRTKPTKSALQAEINSIQLIN